MSPSSMNLFCGGLATLLATVVMLPSNMKMSNVNQLSKMLVIKSYSVLFINELFWKFATPITDFCEISKISRIAILKNTKDRWANYNIIY